MSTHRMQQINQAVQEALARAMVLETSDPRLNRVTVTAVQTSKDLHHAKVFVTVSGTDEERRETEQAIQRAEGFLRSKLAENVRMKYIPELRFVIDEREAHTHRIEELLREAGDLSEEDRP